MESFLGIFLQKEDCISGRKRLKMCIRDRGAMGSDAAIEAADVVLMDDDPLKISKAVSYTHLDVYKRQM